LSWAFPNSIIFFLRLIHEVMLDKNKWIMPIVVVSITGISAWIVNLLISANITVQSKVEPANQHVSLSITDSKAVIVEKIAKEVTIRILGHGSPGSGVIISQRGGFSNKQDRKTYTVLTCQHVVSDGKKGSYQVLLLDGKTYVARVKFTPKFKGLDLAIVEFESETNYRVVKLDESQQLSPNTSVYAAGFPNYQTIDAKRIEETSNWGKRAFRLTAGKVGSVSIAPRSLQEGYSLGYTNEVASGMSGGPVFNDRGELVGINGRLKYPLQGIDAFTFADGTKPSVEKFQQMEALSWAIPIATYQQTTKK
jgi:serine protease Do